MAKNKSRTQLISVKDEFDDIWDLITQFRRDKRNISEFFCKAARFYLKNQENFTPELTEERVRLIVKEEFEMLLEDMDIKKKEELINIDEMISNAKFEAVFSSFESDIDEG